METITGHIKVPSIGDIRIDIDPGLPYGIKPHTQWQRQANGWTVNIETSQGRVEFPYYTGLATTTAPDPIEVFECLWLDAKTAGSSDSWQVTQNYLDEFGELPTISGKDLKIFVEELANIYASLVRLGIVTDDETVTEAIEKALEDHYYS